MKIDSRIIHPFALDNLSSSLQKCVIVPLNKG